MKAWTAWAGATATSFLVGIGMATAPMLARADATLYSIGPDGDGDGVGRVLTPVAPAGPGASLGDGSAAFNGGLAWSASTSTMFAIGNDSFGNSFLTSFALTAPTALAAPVSLGQGFLGGLALDGATAQLYAVASDDLGDSSLYSVGASGAIPLGTLGVGFFGGLAYDAKDGDLYAIGADDSFDQNRLFRIDLAGATPVVTALFDLGDDSVAFNGGLAYDAATDSFSTIGNDSFGDSSLYDFALGGSGTLSDQGVIGAGFVNVGLAYADANVVIPTVPEPPAGLLLAVGGVIMVARRRVRQAVSSRAARSFLDLSGAA